jgi:quinol monooxygenase YgiN
MSITRINNFAARKGMGDELHAFLRTTVPLIKQTAGCEACVLLRNQQEPDTFVIIEAWASVEAHQASVKNIPPGMLVKAMTLLAGTPTGAYYTTGGS